MANGYTDELTIDRIDSSKNYCPENCRWIPLIENIVLSQGKDYEEWVAERTKWKEIIRRERERKKDNPYLNGADCYQAKLTWEQADEIRKSYIKGSRTNGAPALAKKYGVCLATIYKILNKQAYYRRQNL